MKKIFFAILLLSSLYCFSQEQMTIPPDAEAFYNKAMPVLKKKYRDFVTETAQQLKGHDINSDSLVTATKNNVILGIASNPDIEALCLLVLMQASKSAQEDLKAIMRDVKQINAEKANMRSIQKVRPVVPKVDSFKKVASVRTREEIKRDSLSELGQLQEMRLQMYMDRRSKTLSMISNIMKKISDTQNQIIQNLK